MWESMKIASLCDTYDVNCAAHNFCGHLGTAISAHFLASIPNLRVLEYQHEQPAWAAELFTAVPTLVRKQFSRAIIFLLSVFVGKSYLSLAKTGLGHTFRTSGNEEALYAQVDGELDVAALCQRPGWGIEVNEEVLRAHPSQRPHGTVVMTAAPPAVADGGGGGARL